MIINLLRSLTLFMIVFFPFQALAALKVSEVAGSIPRDLSKGYFDISVTIDDILPTDASPTSSEKSIAQRLKMYLTKVDDDEPIPYAAVGTSKLGFYFTEIQNAVLTTNDSKNKTAVFYIRIYAQDAATGLSNLITKEAANQATMNITYDGGNGKQDLDNPYAILRKVGVAKTAPTEVVVEATHLSLVASWPFADSISYQGAADSAPSGAIAVAIDNGSVTSLPAKVYNTDPTLEVDTTCTFTPMSSDAGACISCGSNEGTSYLNFEELQKTSGVTATRVTAGEALMSGLSKDKQYAVFVYYEPDGLTRSTCQLAQPTVNYSLTEYNGGSDAKQGDPRCFVATAAYGNGNDIQVKSLRWFRDEFLLRYVPNGPNLVEWYYKNSPPVAEAVKSSSWLRLAVRTALWPLVALSETMQSLSVSDSELNSNKKT